MRNSKISGLEAAWSARSAAATPKLILPLIPSCAIPAEVFKLNLRTDFVGRCRTSNSRRVPTSGFAETTKVGVRRTAAWLASGSERGPSTCGNRRANSSRRATSTVMRAALTFYDAANWLFHCQSPGPCQGMTFPCPIINRTSVQRRMLLESNVKARRPTGAPPRVTSTCQWPARAWLASPWGRSKGRNVDQEGPSARKWYSLS